MAEPSEIGSPDGADNSGCAGCLIILGLIIVACSLGTIMGGAYGWLALGLGLLLIGVLAALSR